LSRPGEVCFWQILLQKSFWGGDRKFPKSLMRFTRGEVRDHIVLSKIDHASRNGVEKRRSDRVARRSTLARFFGLFDFGLLQQYRRLSDLLILAASVGYEG